MLDEELNISTNPEDGHTKARVIDIKGLSKAFGNNRVLNGFDLDLFEGENLVVIGKSGSGKSVMIKCLIGLMPADEGDIDVLGKDIITIKQEVLDDLRTDVGFLFQGSALYDSMTVRENLEFPMRRHHKKLGKNYNSEELVLEALENVGNGRYDAGRTLRRYAAPGCPGPYPYSKT